MTPREIEDINRRRLASWRHRLSGEHATPLLLVGCGHDHARGAVVLCTMEDGPSERELAAILQGAVNKLLGLGATGRYPDGHTGPDDQGELRAALSLQDTPAGPRVRLDLGKSLSWLSMTAEQAKEIGLRLLQKADQCAARGG